MVVVRKKLIPTPPSWPPGPEPPWRVTRRDVDDGDQRVGEQEELEDPEWHEHKRTLTDMLAEECTQEEEGQGHATGDA